MHRCGISGTGGLICKAEIETQTERKDIQTPRREEGYDELGDWNWHVHCSA